MTTHAWTVSKPATKWQRNSKIRPPSPVAHKSPPTNKRLLSKASCQTCQRQLQNPKHLPNLSAAAHTKLSTKKKHLLKKASSLGSKACSAATKQKRPLPIAKNPQTRKTTSAKAVKADATHVVVAVDAAAEVVTALNAESVAKKVAASAPPAAVIDQNVVNALSAVTATNVAIAPSAQMVPTIPTQRVAHRVKNADAADAMAQLLVRAMRPTSPTCPTCPTTPKPLAKSAVQKTPCKHKPRCAPRHATNALRVKTMVMLAKRQTPAKPLAVNVHRVAKTAATSVLAMMKLPKPKHLRACLLPKRHRLTAKQVQTTTVNAANAVLATVMAATAASAVVSAPIAKKALHKSN